VKDVAFQVEGLKETRREIKELGDKELGKALARANKSAAQIVVDAALPNVPTRTGALRESVRAMGSQAAGRARAGNKTVAYAAAVHWGTGPRPGLRGPHNIRRRPFLWVAADRLRRDVEEAYAIEMDAIVDRLRSEQGRVR
jgi:HK97 gp10 family phage protein